MPSVVYKSCFQFEYLNQRNKYAFWIQVSCNTYLLGDVHKLVDQILHIIDHLPYVDIGLYCYIRENLCIPLTFPVPPKYLPRLVNVLKKASYLEG